MYHYFYVRTYNVYTFWVSACLVVEPEGSTSANTKASQ
jgi:hypothetical protein